MVPIGLESRCASRLGFVGGYDASACDADGPLADRPLPAIKPGSGVPIGMSEDNVARQTTRPSRILLLPLLPPEPDRAGLAGQRGGGNGAAASSRATGQRRPSLAGRVGLPHRPGGASRHYAAVPLPCERPARARPGAHQEGSRAGTEAASEPADPRRDRAGLAGQRGGGNGAAASSRQIGRASCRERV